jgi:hypothetical protein
MLFSLFYSRNLEIPKFVEDFNKIVPTDNFRKSSSDQPEYTCVGKLYKLEIIDILALLCDYYLRYLFHLKGIGSETSVYEYSVLIM